MNSRRLGGAGLKVSELSFGAWVSFKTQMGGDTVYDCMAAAYDGGRVSHVDENMQALDVVDKLTPDVIARVESILNNKPE